MPDFGAHQKWLESKVIASAIDVSQPTISRELTRNTGGRGYRPSRRNKRQSSGALVSIVERVTNFTVSAQVNSKSAADVTQVTIALLRPLKAVVHTITADNGKEFAYHEKISAALSADFYFSQPYRSWERGLNETTNGLLRQYFPKDKDLKEVTQMEVGRAVRRLNYRSRKGLEYKILRQLISDHRAALAA